MSSSTTTVERTSSSVREFLGALRQGSTYNLRRNVYALFGFLWGIPVPLFSIGIDQWATGEALHHSIHLIFLVHPLLFAVVFGAMGTVRQGKDRQINDLVSELRRRRDELSKANEQLLELDKLKAQFIGNVTHELKTPLVSIRGYTEAILEGRFGPITVKQREGLQIATRNVKRLQALIDEVLEFEKIDSGELRLEVTEFDLIPTLHSTLENFRTQLEAKHLQVQLRLPQALVVRADREKIIRVLQNLISNAVKFTPDNAVIGINALADSPSRHAFVTVWDRGPGIPTAAQQYLFTRFWQADGSSTRKHEGTGLGLAICKGILEAHGATIEIVSSEGAGTMVYFTIPLSEETCRERETAHTHRG